MQPKSRKLLEDICDAANFIVQSVAGKSFADYDSDRLLRQAIERNFEIIGEAINRLARIPSIAFPITGRLSRFEISLRTDTTSSTKPRYGKLFSKMYRC